MVSYLSDRKVTETEFGTRKGAFAVTDLPPVCCLEKDVENFGTLDYNSG